MADLDSGSVLTPYAALSRKPSVSFEARHGLGYSIFRSQDEGVAMTVTQTVDRTRPVKFSKLVLKNTSGQARRLRVYGYAEWILGNNPQRTQSFILSSRDEATGALFASNPYSIDYNSRTALFGADVAASSFTTSRREFLGRFGSMAAPAAVASGAALTGTLEPDGAPCAALACDIELAAGEEKTITFFMGDCGNGKRLRLWLPRFAVSVQIRSLMVPRHSGTISLVA